VSREQGAGKRGISNQQAVSSDRRDKKNAAAGRNKGAATAFANLSRAIMGSALIQYKKSGSRD